MKPTPMQKGASTLRALGRGEMITLALGYLESQMMAEKLLRPEPPALVSQELLTERVRQMTDTELIALLMPISALGHSD